MNKMGLKYSLSITTLTIWLEVIFFIYGPDVIVEFCYKTVTVRTKWWDFYNLYYDVVELTKKIVNEQGWSSFHSFTTD